MSVASSKTQRTAITEAPTARSGQIGAAATTADNIAKIAAKKRGNKTALNPTQLDALAAQFETFYGEAERDVTVEHEQQEDRLVSLERYVQRIERSLVTEQERRVEMYQLVQSNLQQQCDALKHRTRAQFEALQPEIPARLAQWHERLAVNEQSLEEEKVRTRLLIERERARLNKMLDDFQANLELEKVERLEREAITLKKVIDENFGLGQAVDEERARREATLGHIRDDNDVIDSLRDKPDAVFKENMMVRMVKATKDIKLETSRRVTAERQFVESLDSYNKGLQGGLRLVNSKAPYEGPLEY